MFDELFVFFLVENNSYYNFGEYFNTTPKKKVASRWTSYLETGLSKIKKPKKFR